ncbi:MAG: Fe-S cluster assembly ATPase SufC [Bacilli bacterium]|nr:Fe-S cluster assembly ATPase SufC [Bacilli bacterium]
MLNIKNLSVKVIDSDINILNKLNLEIGNGEVHAIMGPNGTGKSTLAKIIMGHYQYEVTNGSIKFNNKDITKLSVDERAKLGIFLSMQDPTVIDGVSNSEFIRTAQNEINGSKTNLYEFIKSMESSLDDLKLDSNMIHRSINKDFSGGEKKKNEILQLKLLKPKFIILDELDSGLDVDSLKIVSKNINNYLKENKDCSILIITHYPRILEYIKPDYVHILKDGNIKKTGDMKLALEIEKNGYQIIGEENE